jgi:sterol desaturase/sphingolipid hydroxylase (fatty acid hydroxylase superfamily)
MHPNLIALAIPVFFAAVIAESWIDRREKKKIYRFGSAIADLDAGLVSQVIDVFLKGLGLALYAVVYRYRWVTFPEGSVWPWVVGLVGIDFLYYWWHRMSHVVNLLWAVHAVHHQSEDFNLAVALRQPAFEALTIIPFHLPLAVLGVEPWIYVSCYAIDLIYQFWIHTELPRKLGWLEWVLNTPSLHRVHHGINPKYLDRNYGGILSIWDRIFGTYQVEQEPAVYGVTHPLASYNPLWANLAPFRDIAALVRAAPGAGDKVRAVFAHPAWRPAGFVEAARSAPIARETTAKYDPRCSKRVIGYVFTHFALLTASGGVFLSASERGTLGDLVVPGFLILLSALALAAWTEGRRWAMGLDLARQAAVVAFVATLVGARLGWAVALAVAAGLAVVLTAIFAAFRPKC